MARTKAAAAAARRPKAKAKPAAKPRAQKRPRPEDDHDQDMDQDQDEDSSDVESGAGPELQSIGLFGRTSGWQEYPVDKILNVRKKKGQLEYKVAWQGHRRCTWEPTRNLAHAADLAWARSMFLVTGFFTLLPFISNFILLAHCCQTVRRGPP